MDVLEQLQRLDPGTLAPIVCRALGSDSAELLSWHSRLHEHAGSRGKYHHRRGVSRIGAGYRSWCDLLMVADRQAADLAGRYGGARRACDFGSRWPKIRRASATGAARPTRSRRDGWIRWPARWSRRVVSASLKDLRPCLASRCDPDRNLAVVGGPWKQHHACDAGYRLCPTWPSPRAVQRQLDRLCAGVPPTNG